MLRFVPHGCQVALSSLALPTCPHCGSGARSGHTAAPCTVSAHSKRLGWKRVQLPPGIENRNDGRPRFSSVPCVRGLRLTSPTFPSPLQQCRHFPHLPCKLFAMWGRTARPLGQARYRDSGVTVTPSTQGIRRILNTSLNSFIFFWFRQFTWPL